MFHMKHRMDAIYVAPSVSASDSPQSAAIAGFFVPFSCKIMYLDRPKVSGCERFAPITGDPMQQCVGKPVGKPGEVGTILPTVNNLTDSKCRAARAREKPYKLFDGYGLYLAVSPAGGRVWRMAYRIDGKQQTATIGPYPLVGLTEARAKRDELRTKMLAGQDIKPRAPGPEIPTLEKACETFWGGRKDISESYRANALRALQMHIYPKLKNVPLDQVDRTSVLASLDVMDAAGLHEYVRKTRAWLGQVFEWGIEREFAQVNPCAQINPRKAFAKSKVVSFAALELTQIPAFMQRLELEGLIQSAMACRLLALTGVRTKELRMMTWDEIDGDLWRVPAVRMKKDRDHLVPLSTQAQAILTNMRARAKGSPYVFPNDRRLDRPMSENSVLYLLHRMGYKGTMTGHGWRSVMSTWANEAGYNADAIERQLAHVPGDKVRGIYNRAEFMPERRRMLQDWADWLMPNQAAERQPQPGLSETSIEFSG